MDEVKQARGAGSFCVPRAVITALIENQANAYEICTYLTLARFTDETGVYSTASVSAVNRYTGARKPKNGPVDRALQRLKSIRVRKALQTASGKSQPAPTDMGPILFDRESWIEATGEVLPDGPTERSAVMHVLPAFDEPLDERVWFSNDLVGGFGDFKQPLKSLKDAGDVAARMLLALYELNDMETWGGVRPIGKRHGPWNHYEPVDSDIPLGHGLKLHRAKRAGPIGPGALFGALYPLPGSWWKAHDEAGGPVWRALEALESTGLIYEVVMVLNRNAKKATFTSGQEYGDIADDAEPFYELDCRSQHGYKPEGEEGVGWATARTAGDLGHPVTLVGGKFDGTYGAIVPAGFGCMIAGIFRPRFRVSNPKNAGVKGAWAGIYQRNREALEMVNRLRMTVQLDPLSYPQVKPPKVKQQPAKEWI